MKKVLIVAAILEGFTGVVLLANPSIVPRLLFGADVAGAGAAMSRITGICLIALSVACWPDGNMLRGFCGMLTYSTIVMVFCVIVAAGGEVGILLWPAVAFHAGLSFALVWARWKQPNTAHATT